MDIKKRLASIQAAVRYLKGQGIITKQQDIVDKTGYTKSTVSLALNGNEKYLTESFIKEFNKVFGSLFCDQWLLTGEGKMLNDDKYLLKDNSAVINGNGNSVVSGEHNKLEVSKCQDELEAAMREIQYLKNIIHEKDKRLEEKDKHLADKERLINVLMNK